MEEGRLITLEEAKTTLKYYVERDNDTNLKPLSRYQRLVDLLETGVAVKEFNDYFLVNDKFIVATQKNRWRVKGKIKWYYFKSVEDLVKRYIRKNKND